ncbi:UPF0172-domain-containing protein [Russula compacta]|nr:UPF0172-domain-containing protein [Russula compacta]
MASPLFRLTDLAYTKLILHALKYPHQTINGVLLGTQPTPNAPVDVVDAVPLQHHWTNLTPMTEVGLGMAVNYAHSRQLSVVGYYQASERVGDTALSPVGEIIATKIKETFATPVALVLDGSRLEDQDGGALVAYVPLSSSSSSTACRRVENKLRFDWTVATRALRLIRNNNILDQFWDFDDYLEDNRVPFLTNGTVEPALNSLRQGA